MHTCFVCFPLSVAILSFAASCALASEMCATETTKNSA